LEDGWSDAPNEMTDTLFAAAIDRVTNLWTMFPAASTTTLLIEKAVAAA
jgi:hypothetical protein